MTTSPSEKKEDATRRISLGALLGAISLEQEQGQYGQAQELMLLLLIAIVRKLDAETYVMTEVEAAKSAILCGLEKATDIMRQAGVSNEIIGPALEKTRAELEAKHGITV